jgi:charged multivesicular body protein 4
VHLDKKIEVTLTEAKLKAAKKDKAGAMFALKRKKMFEAEVSKLQGAKITLESQVMALESAAVNVDTLKVMKQATDTMKATRQNM